MATDVQTRGSPMTLFGKPPGPQDARPRGRAAAQALRVVLRALLLLLGLTAVGLGFARFVDTYHEGWAYRGAPVCGAPAIGPGVDCTLRESGRVTKRATERDGDSTSYTLTVAREKAPTADYDVGEAFYDDVRTDTVVNLTVWRGQVVEVDYHGHRARNPHTLWLAILKLALLVGAGTALVTGGLLGPNLRSWWTPAGMSVPMAVTTQVGAAMILLMGWPLPVTVTLAVLAWLLALSVISGMSAD
ncbi:hypothetical protein [Kitasatospora sp. NBC_01300]|uniref:hypothetical protein n=1 Tax=Kitasatospora sp. NBC_01300 TaxID=2903574 RepID=UPI00352BFDDD|nr:hypothetical protein OG556_01195 [Kitasatospora sp. NBC_01300]